MKIYLVNIVQIILIVSFVMSMFTLAANVYRDSINGIRGRVVKESIVTIMQYLKKLKIKDYMVFEKYGMWRFSSRY